MKHQVSTSLLVVAAFVLGVAVTHFLKPAVESTMVMGDQFSESPFGDTPFTDPPFKDSPFKKKDQLQRELDQIFDRYQKSWPLSWNWSEDPFRQMTVPAVGISMREDGDQVQYVLELPGKSVAKVDVSTQDGYVTIVAELTEKSEKPGAISQSTTTINQRFPLPGQVDPDSVAVVHKDGEVVISFRRITA